MKPARNKTISPLAIASSVLATIIVLVGSPARATIIVPAGPPWSITVNANDPFGGPSGVTQSISPSASLVQTLTATDNDSTTSVDIAMSQSAFVFDVSFQTAGNPLGGAGSGSLSTLIRFSVDTPTHYTIDGSWIATDLTGNGSAQLVALLDESVDVFYSDQQHYYTPGLLLLELDGSPGGNNVNNITGASSGTLQPGINYRLILTAALATNQTTASGNFGSSQLSINFGSVVPEPSSYALAVLSLVGLALYGWRRRRAFIPI